jgi:hypothetical protein
MTDSELLKLLITRFFFVNNTGGLEWVFREGHSLKDEDPDMNAELIEKFGLNYLDRS